MSSNGGNEFRQPRRNREQRAAMSGLVQVYRCEIVNQWQRLQSNQRKVSACWNWKIGLGRMWFWIYWLVNFEISGVFFSFLWQSSHLKFSYSETFKLGKSSSSSIFFGWISFIWLCDLWWIWYFGYKWFKDSL